MEKNVFKEIVKNEKLIVLIDSKLSSMRGIINKSLKDKKISEEEYKYIEYEFNEYKQMKGDVCFTCFTKSVKKGITKNKCKRNCREIGRIVKEVKSLHVYLTSRCE